MNELEAVAAAAQTDKTAELIDLTNNEYHARPEWSNSQLKLLPDDPLLFYGRHIVKTMPGPSSPIMDFCSDVHRVVLEDVPMVTIPKTVLTSNGQRRGKAWDAFKAENADAVLVKVDDPLLYVVRAIFGHPLAGPLIESDGPVEQSILWRDVGTDLPLRCRPDKLAWLPKENWQIDLKGSKEPRPGARFFGREIATFGYHRQHALYGDGVALAYPEHPIDVHAFIAFRHCPPYDVWVHTLTDDDMILGGDQNRRALEDLASRLQTDDWTPADYGKAHETHLPAWAYNQEYQEHDYE